MCKNYLILYIFLLNMVNLHTANAHHELEDQNIVNGEENYQAHCASCHGVDLEGQPNWRTMKADGSLPAPPHDETGHTWHHDTKMLFDYTKYGGQKTLAAVGITDYKSGIEGLGSSHRPCFACQFQCRRPFRQGGLQAHPAGADGA